MLFLSLIHNKGQLDELQNYRSLSLTIVITKLQHAFFFLSFKNILKHLQCCHLHVQGRLCFYTWYIYVGKLIKTGQIWFCLALAIFMNTIHIKNSYTKEKKQTLYIYVNKCLKIHNAKYIILNIFNSHTRIGGSRKFFRVNLGLFAGGGVRGLICM